MDLEQKKKIGISQLTYHLSVAKEYYRRNNRTNDWVCGNLCEQYKKDPHKRIQEKLKRCNY